MGFVAVQLALLAQPAPLTQIRGRPTGHSITVSVLSPDNLAAYVEYGIRPGGYSVKTSITKLQPDKPVEFVLDHLQPNTRYYSPRYRQTGNSRGRFHRDASTGWPPARV